jgi:hypothetical protein
LYKPRQIAIEFPFALSPVSFGSRNSVAIALRSHGLLPIAIEVCACPLRTHTYAALNSSAFVEVGKSQCQVRLRKTAKFRRFRRKIVFFGKRRRSSARATRLKSQARDSKGYSSQWLAEFTGCEETFHLKVFAHFRFAKKGDGASSF